MPRPATTAFAAGRLLLLLSLFCRQMRWVYVSRRQRYIIVIVAAAVDDVFATFVTVLNDIPIRARRAGAIGVLSDHLITPRAGMERI